MAVSCKLRVSHALRFFVAASVAVVGLVAGSAVRAGPWLAPGDTALRSDVQLLADAGIITAPVTTWPLSWGDIAASLDVSGGDLTAYEMAAMARLQKRLAAATITDQITFNAHTSVAANPIQIRSFEDTPREDAEVGVGLKWTGDWFAASLQGQWVDDPLDGDEWRADGSYLGVALGNWMLAGSVTDRWWGPGWQGSLILSSNARPIPAFTLERNLTAPFETKWLSWMGSWDLAIFYGFLEEERVVPNPHIFGGRLNFKPFQSLEIGMSRTVMICGDGQPCGVGDFFDALFGNEGGDTSANQLGGIDARWAHSAFDIPFALYTQWIGEDASSFFPTDWLGQFGGETWGHWEKLGTYRLYLEWSDTECDFRLYRSIRNDSGPGQPGCAYWHSTYETGYRYKGRAIGHSFDGDASVFTLGGVLTDDADHSWQATLAIGNLNRRNARPNSVADNKTRYREIEVSHKRQLWVGYMHAGLGYDYRKDTVTNNKHDDVRVFLDWSFDY